MTNPLDMDGARQTHRPGVRAGIAFLALVPLLTGAPCAPYIKVVTDEIAVYNITSPGQLIESGHEIGIRIPLAYTGAGPVALTAELLDKNGLPIQERNLELAGADPVFDLGPFDTDVPGLIDSAGEATFRIHFGAPPKRILVYDHTFPILSVLVPDISVLEDRAASYVPFHDYPLNDCFGVFNGTAGLLAALELHVLDPAHPLAISPAEAETQVRHQAESLLPQYYDPLAPNTHGPCRLVAPVPDSTTGLAALAFLLKVHGSDWGSDTRDAIRRAIQLPDWRYVGNTNVYNKAIAFPALHLLFGEAACHAPSWQQGWGELSGMFLNHLRQGGFEANDRHYTAYHLANLGMIDFLDTQPARDMGRYLYDLKLLLSAHMYLPGGFTGALNTRLSGTGNFYFPADPRERSMGPVLAALAVGSDFEFTTPRLTPHTMTSIASMLAIRRPLSPTIRRLFLTKGDGYEAWWLERTGKSIARMPGTESRLGEDGAVAFAWQQNVLPGGAAVMATSYGAWNQSIGNKEGVAVRCPNCEQGFAFTYQWQACVAGDTDDGGDTICGGSTPGPKGSGYDAERMQVHRSRISLFDPRSRTSRWHGWPTRQVPRVYELTQAYLTNWSHPAVGGETIFPTPGGWYVGRLGEVFIAYRPVGDSIQVSQIAGERLFGGPLADFATFFEMDGRSGGMTILADPSEFSGDTLADFAAEMDARYWSFTAAGPNDGPVAELDYCAADGGLCRMKLEYMGVGGLPGKERRYIDCSAALGTDYQEQTEAEFFADLYGGQLMSSPFVSYDTATDVLQVSAPPLPPVSYDWGALRSVAEPIPDGCSERAYLELGEPPDLALEVVWPAPVPHFGWQVENTGFAPTTVEASFVGDDCTAGPELPNAAWLSPVAGNAVIPAGGIGGVLAMGSAAPCDPGEHFGELIISSLEENAADARLPVRLTVLP